MRRRTAFLAGLAAGLVAVAVLGPAGVSAKPKAPPPAPGPPPCGDEDRLCFEEAMPGAAYLEMAVTNDKDLGSRGKGNPGSVKFEMDVERASLFVNGRYVGTTPIETPVPMPAGKNDIHVRAGRDLVTKGVLTVPPGAHMRVKVRDL